MVLLVLALMVGFLNEGLITVNYLLAQATIRVSTFITIVLGGGIVIGLALLLPAYLRVRMQLASLRQKHNQAESSS
ncbi:LapA family protein [Alteromonas sediminis]|uniref:LapA family protein n=1 Tax=Alteromonas sediminis TaxID=2259342 RepID=A0A3N5Y8Y2_9ALTE|nr:LapA family protein [Alteromonas sediminis]